MSLRIIAILAAYNEERFVAGCLEHYARHGVEVYLIDNGSTDRTYEIAKQYLGHGLLGIESLPRDGVNRLEPILKLKEQLAHKLEADWFMHADLDEIRLPPRSDWTLAQAFEHVDQLGYNAVNFQEFTFIPVRESPDHDHPDFQQTMRWYYPFLPVFPHQLKAWKQQPQPVDLASFAGHLVRFPNLRMFPDSFPMRHYQFLSVEHAVRKYPQMQFDENELQKGWQGWRGNIKSHEIVLPASHELRSYITDDLLDASQPQKRHYLDDLIRPANHRVLSKTNQAVLPVPFIIGTGRSGTTLLRLMLDSHSELAIPAETHFIPALINNCANNEHPQQTFLHVLQTSERRKDWPINWTELQRQVAEIQPFDLASALRAFYHLYARRFNKQRWGDKTPAYMSSIAEIAELLPEAHFIHIIRDGRDVALSLQESFWGPKLPIEAAQWWLGKIKEARSQSSNSQRYLEIKFEDLIVSPENTLRKICDFIRLPFHPAMLEYYKHVEERLGELSDTSAPREARLSGFKLTGLPPQISRVNRWCREMPIADLRQFESSAGPLLKELGYPLSEELTVDFSAAPETIAYLQQELKQRSQTIFSLKVQLNSLQTKLNQNSPSATRASEIQTLQAQINELQVALKGTQHIAQVASREVENLHQGQIFRLANFYWQWRDRVRRLLWPFGKSKSK